MMGGVVHATFVSSPLRRNSSILVPPTLIDRYRRSHTCRATKKAQNQLLHSLVASPSVPLALDHPTLRSQRIRCHEAFLEAGSTAWIVSGPLERIRC